MGKNLKRLLLFAIKYPGYNSYGRDRATVDAVNALARLGAIEISETSRQFRIALPSRFYNGTIESKSATRDESREFRVAHIVTLILNDGDGSQCRYNYLYRCKVATYSDSMASRDFLDMVRNADIWAKGNGMEGLQNIAEFYDAAERVARYYAEHMKESGVAERVAASRVCLIGKNSGSVA